MYSNYNLPRVLLLDGLAAEEAELAAYHLAVGTAVPNNDDDTSERGSCGESEYGDEFGGEDPNGGDHNTLHKQSIVPQDPPPADPETRSSSPDKPNSPEDLVLPAADKLNSPGDFGLPAAPLTIHLSVPGRTRIGTRSSSDSPMTIVIETMPRPTLGLTLLSQPLGVNNSTTALTTGTPYEELERYIRRLVRPFAAQLQMGAIVNQVWIVSVVCSFDDHRRVGVLPRGMTGDTHCSVVTDREAWEVFVSRATARMVGVGEGRGDMLGGELVPRCPCGCGHKIQTMGDEGGSVPFCLPPLVIRLWMA